MKTISRRAFLGSGLATGAVTLAQPTWSTPIRRKRSTGLVSDMRYRDHVIRAQHPESPQRLVAIHRRLTESGLLDSLTAVSPLADPDPYIAAVHTRAHRDAINAIPVSGQVARLAVAGVCGAVDQVCNGGISNAFCAVRPPGHHARNTGRPEGFCYYNTIAAAARFAQRAHGVGKVLIIDWDYHHGNATEEFFYEDPSVLFFSTHDKRAYPGTGSPRRKGAGKGKGLSINVHLGCGATDQDMLGAWERHLLPAAHAFKPELVLISAGFDSRVNDTLGCFKCTDICFARMTSLALDIADSYAGGRLVSALEGGYNIEGQAEAVMAHVQSLRRPL
jgi:acetoin utilization deacetylase AcuC-like enzyme